MRTHDRANFVRLVNRRVPAAIKAVELIANLSNRSNYSFTDDDAKTVIKALKHAVNECEQSFNGRETKAGGFRLE